MVTHTFVNIDLEEAAYLADLTGVEYDLRSTIELCDELKELIEASDYRGSRIDTLSTTISVRYSRSFGSGVRKKINIENIGSINEKLLEEHERILAIRNKHIAHSVNAFEENQVVGYYVLENPEEKGIRSISVQHGRVVGLSYSDADSIIQLSKLALEYVKSEIEKEKSKILKLVRQKDVNEFIYNASDRVPMIGKKDPRKKRKRK
ncbi:MAG: hypothetical protein ACE5HN_00920 [Nitrospiria bacterium]